jgi:methylated-DNA-[protein]-cysteine S-methyltransferase
MSPFVHAHVQSPVGELLLTGDGELLRGLYLPPHRHMPAVDPASRRDDAAFAAARGALAAYFAGERDAFAGLALDPAGTPFQHRVWAALRAIPYGETRSYSELAAALGSPGAARAVGLANGRNPISIVVPCHRVVGADGSLTGYGGGVERKAALLAHERQCPQPALWDAAGVPMEG